MSTFFLALVGLAALETRLSFPDSFDDDAVPFLFLLSFFYYFIQNTYIVSYSTHLACVCHILGL